MLFDDVSSIELTKQFGFHSKHVDSLMKLTQRMILGVRDNYVFKGIVDNDNIFVIFEFDDFLS